MFYSVNGFLSLFGAFLKRPQDNLVAFSYCSRPDLDDINCGESLTIISGDVTIALIKQY